MKKIILLSLFVLPLFISAQEVQPNITEEKMRLLILPSTESERYEEIADRVTAIVASEATQLGRFEIIDRTQLEAIMGEQALQLSGIINDSDVVEIGKIAAAPEALVVTVLTYSQKGVPPDDEEEEDEQDRKTARKFGLFGIITKGIVDAVIDKELEGVERYPNNIQTILSCRVHKIDLETGQSLDAFSIGAEHTGGNKGASLKKTLNIAAWKVAQELRELFLLSSQIVDVRDREVILLLGQNIGLKKGTLFSISSPSTKRTIGEREIIIPGYQVGIVEVTELSQDANRGRVLRKWAPIEPGYPAVESTGKIICTGIGLQYGTGSSDLALEFMGYFNPLGRMGSSIFCGIGTLIDSRDDTDLNIRLGGDIYFRLIDTLPLSLAASLSLPVNIVFRDDDDDNSVAMAMFSPVIGGRLEVMLGAKTDLVATVGFCPTSNMG
ncbi:MAG: hypothetical protein KAK01_08895, partial [Candidatus Marinimicrobia bacterium]|nr:hypothetical protein [Candidatus Neomarinimicrobiota bacterium]